MFNTVPNPIQARMKGLNRAEICDVNFQEFVKQWAGTSQARPAAAGTALFPAAEAMVSAQFSTAPPRASFASRS